MVCRFANFPETMQVTFRLSPNNMMKTIFALVLLCLALAAPAQPLPAIKLQPVFPKLTGERPVWMSEAPDGTGRMFIVYQDGKILIVHKGSDGSDAKEFLNIVDRNLILLERPPFEDVPSVWRLGEASLDDLDKAARSFADNSLDMGTGYDCFDTLANTSDPRITGDQAKNRVLLAEGLERQGFVNYDKEWWHFTFKPAGQGEPYPDTYFDFPVKD